MLAMVTRLFPLWAVALSAVAYWRPSSFTAIGPWVSELLMLIMFGMGVTLSFDDFRRILNRPAPVLAGTFLHYLVMPAAAYGLAKVMHMPAESCGRNDISGECRQRYGVECDDLFGQRRRRLVRDNLLCFGVSRRSSHAIIDAILCRYSYSGRYCRYVMEYC